MGNFRDFGSGSQPISSKGPKPARCLFPQVESLVAQGTSGSFLAATSSALHSKDLLKVPLALSAAAVPTARPDVTTIIRVDLSASLGTRN